MGTKCHKCLEVLLNTCKFSWAVFEHGHLDGSAHHTPSRCHREEKNISDFHNTKQHLHECLNFTFYLNVLGLCSRKNFTICFEAPQRLGTSDPSSKNSCFLNSHTESEACYHPLFLKGRFTARAASTYCIYAQGS